MQDLASASAFEVRLAAVHCAAELELSGCAAGALTRSHAGGESPKRGMSGGAAAYDERCMAYMRMALQQVSLLLSSFGAADMRVS
jgi:hypothetical protein